MQLKFITVLAALVTLAVAAAPKADAPKADAPPTGVPPPPTGAPPPNARAVNDGPCVFVPAKQGCEPGQASCGLNGSGDQVKCCQNVCA